MQKKIDIPQRISHQELAIRRRTLIQSLESNSLDAIIVTGSENEPGALRYLTGYSPAFEQAILVLTRSGSETFISGPESSYYTLINVEISDQLFASDFSNSADPIVNIGSQSSLSSILRKVCPKGNVGVVGLRQASAILIESLRAHGGINSITSADLILARMRMRKSNSEIDLLKSAFLIAERACRKGVEAVESGISERDVERVIATALRLEGAHGLGYPIWCSSGDNTICPIAKSTDRIILEGDLVQLTASAEIHGYCSGVALPVIVGECGKEILSLRNAALDIRSTVFEAIKPGTLSSEVAHIARMRAKRFGFAEGIVHGPAHSVGCMECEWPFIQEKSKVKLEVGMVLNIDIWLGLHNVGLRFEDGVIIGESETTWLSNVLL